MKLNKLKKAILFVDVFVAILVVTFMLTTKNFTQIFWTTAPEKSLAGAETMGFNFLASPEETKTKAGETVTLTLSVADISAGENGINSIVGFLDYKESLFETVEFQGINSGNQSNGNTNVSNSSGWNIEVNRIQGHELYGKFCIYTLQEGVTEDQDVVKITMKLKSDLAPQTTEVNFTNLVSSDGVYEIAEEDRTAVIIIEDAEDDGNQGSEGEGDQGTEGDGDQGTEGDGNQGTEGDGNQGSGGDGNQGSEGYGNQGSEGNGNQNSNGSGNSNNQSNSPQTGDTKILIVLAILILVIIANLLIFCKKSKTKIIATVVTIIVGILSFVIVSNAQNTQNNTQPLTVNDKINKISFQEKILNTDKVLVKDSTISAVTPEMTVEDFLNIFNSQIKITDNETQVTSGELKTGMKVSLLNPTNTDIDKDTIYEVVVAGDINKDGLSNQIELTRIIRNTINNQKWQLTDIEKLAADMNFDGKIDNEDVKASVNYIVYGDYFKYAETVQEDIRNVDAPTIEIVQGQFNEEVNCYIDDVIIRITETDKNASKTRYKIEDENGNSVTLSELVNNSTGNNSSTQYTGLAKFVEIERTNKDENGNIIKQITIKKDGIYKISALTDGELGNRSDITYKVIVKGKSDKKYTVTYDYATNGGVSSIDSQITTEDVDVTYNTPVDLSKQGTKQYYKFIGWNTDKNATTALSTFTMGIQNETLYAIYEKDIKIELEPTSISMEYGSTQTITATTKNTGNIIWTSSDDSIATVSDTGVVTAKKLGTVAITATVSTDSTVTATCQVTVTPKTLTISASADDKEYDGTTNVVNGQILVNGILNTDDVSINANYAYETATAGASKKINVTNITLSGADANNYKVNETTITTSSDITKAELTASYISETITYGETPALKVIVTGFVNGETAEAAEGYKIPTVANTNTAVGTYTLKPQDGQATNYTFKYTEGTLEILSKELTSNDVTINLEQDTFTYDGTEKEPKVIIKDGNKTLVEGTDFTVTYDYNKNAGTGIAKITGKDNYSLSVEKTFTINRVILTPQANANNKVYDGTTSATGTITLTGAVNNEDPFVTGDFAFITSTAENSKTVNVTNIKLTDEYAINYDLSTYTLTATADITPAPLTATYVDETITYGETPALVVKVEGFVNNETEATADGYSAPTVSSTETEVGTYELTPANGQATNYTFKYEKGNLTITAKDMSNQNIEVKLAESKVTYNGKEQKVPVTITDNGLTLTEGKDYDVEYKDNKNAGTATVKVTLKGNYSGTKELSFEIEKAKLTATYAGETIEFGQTPQFKVTVDGFVNNETADTAEEYVAPTVTATNLQQGTYTLTPQGGSAKNYDFNYVSGLLVINAKLNVDIQLAQTQFIYDGTAKEPAVIVKDGNTTLAEGTDYDVVYADNINAGTGTATVTLKGNYAGTAVKTFTIAQAQGTGSVSIEGWTYGENAKTPVPNSNTNTQVTYQYTGTTNGGVSYSSSDAPTQAGNYTVTATFDANNNYKGFTATADFVVDKKELIPTATANNKVYDGTTDATGTIILTGAVGTEMPTATATFTFENATAGSGKLVNVTNIALEDPWNENYKLTTDITTTTADITKDAGTATLSISNWIYGDTASAPIVNSTTNDVTNVTYSYTGTINTGSTYGPSSNVPTEAGSYILTATIPANENYEEVIVTDTFEIEKRTLAVTLTAQDKIYDGNTQATGSVILTNAGYSDIPTATATFTFENGTAGDNKTVNVTNILLANEYTANYTLDKTTETTTANITKAILTAEYAGEVITYGETPVLAVNVTGFVNNETEQTADGYVKPTLTTQEKNVGQHTLIPQGGSATNYSFQYVSGILEILNKNITEDEITISLSQTEYTYDGTAKEPTVTIKDGEKTLTQGTDYTVTYTDNVNAGTATVIIDGAGNYSTQTTKTFEIKKVKLTPSAIVNSKVYDGLTTATGTITLLGAVNNENPVASVSSIFTFENATVGDNKTVTVSNIELEEVWKTNYELTQDTLTLTNGEITKAELTATYLGENITYGETPVLDIHVDGFVNGEDETTAAGYTVPTPVITDKDGNEVEVQDLVVSGSPYTVTPKDGDATNYKFKYEDGVLVVNENPAIVKITLTPDSFVYDGTAKQPAITVTDAATGKVLTANTDYTFGYLDNINAGTGIVNITLIGNYTGIATETFDILQADGIASVSIEGWIYGEPSNNPVPSSSTNGTDNVTYLYTGTTNAGIAYSDSVAPTEAGNYKVTATFAQTQNYKEVKAEDDFTISKAQVAEPAVNTGLVYTGLSQEGVTSGSNYTFTGDRIATNAGDYTAIATLSNTDNYEWTDGTTAPKTYNWSIAKVQLTPSAIANNKVYDGNATATGTISFAEAVNNEKPTAITATYTFENATVGRNKVVTVTNIVLDSQWTTNYALVATQTQTTADITAAKLTATYVSEEINYGETPDLIVEVTGFVNGETKETVAGFTIPVVICTNTEPGEYELTPTGGSAVNYTFDYVKGTLKINLPIYTITYELNGGELEQGKENPDEYTQKSDNITLNNPTKEGYEFLGWTLTKLDGVVQGASTPSTSVTIAKGSKGNREYTANWNLVAPTVQVTAENLDVNLFENQTTTFTATVSNASNPSYQWYYGENAISGATASTYSIATKDMDASNYKGGEYSVKVTNNEPVTTLAETGANTTTTASEKLTQIVKYNEVSSTEQMNNLRIRVNDQAITFEGDTITQTTNIDLSTVCGPNVGNWTAIGTAEKDAIETNMFKGTFDGNNKEITNLYINQDEGMLGLFGIAKGSTIKNVTVSGSITGTGVTYKTVAGGIVARNLSGTIDSCINNVNIVAISRTGGIAGKSEGDSIITNCINNGSITSDVTKTTVESGETICASKWIGGIAGIGQGIISNCTNNATGVIKANQAGGIAGICNNGQTNILNCTNHAELIGNQVGGITYFFKGADQNYKISNCVNTGNITVQYPSTESSLYAAGISCAINGVIENSHNDGNITTISEVGNLGTVVGGIYATENLETVVRKCYNTGDITSHSAHTGTSDKAMSAAGGIAGYMTHNTIIDNTYNTGNITATKVYGTNTNSAGGIVGYVRILEGAEVATTENDSANDEESGENTTTIVKEIVAPFITNSYSTGLISATHNSHSNYNFNGGVIGQYSAETTSITDIVENTYYLNTSSVKGIDNTQEDITNIAIAKTSDYMKTLQFVKDLGQDNWELPVSDAVNYGYPIFGSETIYEITYDLAGGQLEEGKTNPTLYVSDNSNITLNNPIRAGYAFSGWTGTDLTKATENVVIPTGSTGDRTYTATWELLAPTVSLTVENAEVNLFDDFVTTFTANVEESADVTYQWYYNGSAIEGANKKSYGIATTAMNSAETDYSIINSTNYLGGEYSVVVTNSAGQASAAKTQTITRTIGTPEQMKNFNVRVEEQEIYFNGVEVEQVADIDLSSVCNSTVGTWDPIGLYDIQGQGESQVTIVKPFSGTYKGNNYEVTGLYIDTTCDEIRLGLFGYVNGGTINDLTVKGEIKTKTSTSIAAGGIAGYVYNGEVNNCINYAKIDGYRVGGIVGLNGNGTELNNCINYGTITGNYIGGITYGNVGSIYSSVNNGIVSATSNVEAEAVYAGGITYYNNGLIERTYNNNTVTAVGEAKNNGVVAGGIYALDNHNSVVRKSYNKAAVTADCGHDGTLTGAMSAAGGIAGYMRCNTFIENCYNTGDITAKKLQGTNTNSAGGIVGFIQFIEQEETDVTVNTYSTYLVKNCYSVGSITAEHVTQYNAKGGVIGQYRSSNRAITDIVTNTYYLNTTADKGIDYAVDTTAIATPKDSAFMKTDEFVTLLGAENWQIVANENENYPVLNWQYETFAISYDLAGGKLPEGVTNPTNYAESSVAIKLNNPVKDNYVFAGWTGTDLTEATLDVTILTGSTGNRTYTANWTEAYYYNETSDTYYATLADAVSNSPSGSQINVIKNANETKRATVASSKELTLNLNNFTVSYTGTEDVFRLYNEGTLNLIGSGKITSTEGYTLRNAGIMNIRLEDDGIVESIGNEIIDRAIQNSENGTLNIYSGTIQTDAADNMPENAQTYAVIGNTGTTINMYGGKIDAIATHPNQSGIFSEGNVNISGGTITANLRGITMKAAGNLNITKGSISSLINGNTIFFASTGKLSITGTEEVIINSNNVNGIYNSTEDGGNGTIIINNPNATISGNDGIYMETGNVDVIAGTVIGKLHYGILSESEATITIGKDDTTVTQDTPIITGTTYGINRNTGDLNFYDGLIKGATAAFSGEVADKPDDYVVKHRTEDGKDVAYLDHEKQYTVEHYQEQLDGTYKLVETEDQDDGKIGIVGSTVTAVPKTYIGFSENTTHANRVASGEIAADGNLVLKLYYSRNLYKLTVVAGDYITNVTGSSTYKYGESVQVTAIKENLAGYTYSGFAWTSTVNGVLSSTTNTTTTVTIPASDLTVTASQSRVIENYTISYELNNGTVSGTNPTTYNVETANITLINPTKEMYVFRGWTESNGTTPELTVTIPKGSTGNRTYTANWEEARYYNETSKIYYATLAEATDEAESGSTINVIKAANETVTPTVAAGKAVTLDMNGNTVSLSGVSLTNNGTLTITGESGTLTSTIQAIDNGSTGILNKEGNSTITATGAYSTIYNSGKVTLTEGTISSVSLGGIYNRETGQIIVNGGKIETTQVAINTRSELNTDAKPAVLINDGEVKSKDRNAITNYSTNGLIYVKGGTISSTQTQDMPTIYNETGTVKVSGGTITSENDRAVCNYTEPGGEIIITGGKLSGEIAVQNIEGSTLTLGSKADAVSTTTPEIIGSMYGVLNAGTFNFYDGVIKGVEDSFSNPSNNTIGLPDDYEVEYTSEQVTVEGQQVTYDVAYLARIERYTVNYYNGTSLLDSSEHVIGGTEKLTTMSTLGGSKSGYTFSGWTTSTSSTTATYADGASVSNLTTTPSGTVNLYAIWQRNVTFYSGTAKEKTESKVQYYNSKGGNYSVTAPSTIKEVSGWTASGWRANTTADASQIAKGSVSTSSAAEFYAVYTRDITFKSGPSGETSEKVVQYYNSNDSRSEIKMLTPAVVSGWKTEGWRDDTVAGEATYSSNQTVTPVTVTTYYAIYTRNVTFYSGEGNNSSETATQYYNSISAFSTKTPAKTEIEPIDGWTALGWRNDLTAGGSEITPGNKTTMGDSKFYAVYSRNITFKSGINSATSEKVTQYHNCNGAHGSLDMLTPTEIANWECIGWRDDDNARDKEYDLDGRYAPVAVTTYYAVYARNITLKYNANGGTGTVANQTTDQYYNTTGNISTPSFTLADNSFTKSGYEFSKWADGSTSGTQYIAGATYNKFIPAVTDTTISRTMYAIWVATNAAPTAPTTSVASRDIHDFTVSATSTDAESENITYNLYVKTSSETTYTLADTSDSTASGTQVSLTAAELSSYTVYNYYVTATDTNNSTTKSTVKTTGTGCSGQTLVCANVTSYECSDTVGTVCSQISNMTVKQTTEPCSYCGSTTSKVSISASCPCGFSKSSSTSCANKACSNYSEFSNDTSFNHYESYTCRAHDYTGTSATHTVICDSVSIKSCAGTQTKTCTSTTKNSCSGTFQGTGNTEASKCTTCGSTSYVSVTFACTTCGYITTDSGCQRSDCGGYSKIETPSFTHTYYTCTEHEDYIGTKSSHTYEQECAHGITNSHYYCDTHGYAGSETKHSYCSHGKEEEHYPN